MPSLGPIDADSSTSGWPRDLNLRPRKLQEHKTLKNFPKPFGTKRKVAGEGQLGLIDFLPEVGNNLKCEFPRAEVSGFPSGDREAETLQTLALEKPAQHHFQTSGWKSPRRSPPPPLRHHPVTHGPVSAFSHALIIKAHVTPRAAWWWSAVSIARGRDSLNGQSR
jgi:hypothetical protein